MNSDESPPGPATPCRSQSQERVSCASSVRARLAGAQPCRLAAACRSVSGRSRRPVRSTSAITPNIRALTSCSIPLHWVLELTGRAEERWPVRVRIGDRPSVAATLVRPRTDYSAPHPGLSIQLPGALVLDAIAADDSIQCWR